MYYYINTDFLYNLAKAFKQTKVTDIIRSNVTTLQRTTL